MKKFYLFLSFYSLLFVFPKSLNSTLVASNNLDLFKEIAFDGIPFEVIVFDKFLVGYFWNFWNTA